MSYTLILYILFMLAGMFVGSKKMSKEKEYKWIGKIQFWGLMVLLSALGIQIGSNEQVVASLSTLGFSALFIALSSMAGSVLCLYFVRRWIGLDKEGVRKDD